MSEGNNRSQQESRLRRVRQYADSFKVAVEAFRKQRKVDEKAAGSERAFEDLRRRSYDINMSRWNAKQGQGGTKQTPQNEFVDKAREMSVLSALTNAEKRLI